VCGMRREDGEVKTLKSKVMRVTWVGFCLGPKVTLKKIIIIIIGS